jgi:hypothetical protein
MANELERITEKSMSDKVKARLSAQNATKKYDALDILGGLY